MLEDPIPSGAEQFEQRRQSESELTRIQVGLTGTAPVSFEIVAQSFSSTGSMAT